MWVCGTARRVVAKFDTRQLQAIARAKTAPSWRKRRVLPAQKAPRSAIQTASFQALPITEGAQRGSRPLILVCPRVDTRSGERTTPRRVPSSLSHYLTSFTAERGVQHRIRSSSPRGQCTSVDTLNSLLTSSLEVHSGRAPGYCTFLPWISKTY